MKMTLKKVSVFSDEGFRTGNVSFHTGNAVSIPSPLSDASSLYVFPGFTDVHVHFREPGFSYKETILTGSMAAAHGGYTAVCTMPNLTPTPDTLKNLSLQLERIKDAARISVLPYGSISKGEDGKELSDMEALAPFVCGFSDDGRGVNDTYLMKEAMLRAKALDKVIAAHCEDALSPKDSPEAEWRQIERDIRLVSDIGCKYHVCHISTKESVALIRDAKKSGVNITCETAPHYLTLTDAMKEDSGNFRMNPPLRSGLDVLALIDGVFDGTIDMIATDHAPHSAEEKGRGFAKSLNGVVGLETAFPVLFTSLVSTGIISLERLVKMMSVAPRERFGIADDGFTVYDLNREYVIDSKDFLSMGKSSPFLNQTVRGTCVATVYKGRAVYMNPEYFGAD